MNPILMRALRRRAVIAVAASAAVITACSDSLSSGGNNFGDKSPPAVKLSKGAASPSFDVSDFIANSFATVQGVAMNFDGSLSGIRADSTYLLSPTLRLEGIFALRTATPVPISTR